jgi:hypothetical protein
MTYASGSTVKGFGKSFANAAAKQMDKAAERRRIRQETHL